MLACGEGEVIVIALTGREATWWTKGLRGGGAKLYQRMSVWPSVAAALAGRREGASVASALGGRCGKRSSEEWRAGSTGFVNDRPQILSQQQH